MTNLASAKVTLPDCLHVTTCMMPALRMYDARKSELRFIPKCSSY
jgi:hypothetical protein